MEQVSTNMMIHNVNEIPIDIDIGGEDKNDGVQKNLGIDDAVQMDLKMDDGVLKDSSITNEVSNLSSIANEV